MIAAVLLAGARSRRSGRRHKACRRLPGERRSWLDRQIDVLRAAGVGRIVLVLGHRPRRVRACLHRRVVMVCNPHPAYGPFSSLQHGLRATRGDTLASPLDAPLPPAFQLRRMLRAGRGVDAVVALGRDGRGGHPVLLSRRFARRLTGLDPADADARLDIQLRMLAPERRRRLVLDIQSTRRNLNTAQAWRAYVRRLPVQAR
ncbi:nucleotidyltransferase family protein [Acidihalobacter prosperus]